jgi:hypothetical protein
MSRYDPNRHHFNINREFTLTPFNQMLLVVRPRSAMEHRVVSQEVLFVLDCGGERGRLLLRSTRAGGVGLGVTPLGHI